MDGFRSSWLHTGVGVRERLDVFRLPSFWREALAQQESKLSIEGSPEDGENESGPALPPPKTIPYNLLRVGCFWRILHTQWRVVHIEARGAHLH
jgi:hypothetical protein